MTKLTIMWINICFEIYATDLEFLPWKMPRKWDVCCRTNCGCCWLHPKWIWYIDFKFMGTFLVTFSEYVYSAVFNFRKELYVWRHECTFSWINLPKAKNKQTYSSLSEIYIPVAQMLSRASLPPLHRMPCQASDSLRRIIWQIWVGKEGIFPWHHEPMTAREERNKRQPKVKCKILTGNK